jgi:three-Cys-motif partner protein
MGWVNSVLWQTVEADRSNWWGQMAADHEFGAQHTDLKLSIVESYLKSFTTALKPHFSQLWYIDAFAGTGERTVRVAAREGDLFDEPAPESVERRRGSAKIAIDVEPPFDRLIFIDIKRRHCEALRRLAAEHADRDIQVVTGDANKALQKEIEWPGWGDVRAVIFLDPYGMNVEWETLQSIAKTQAIDVWYLFPLSGLYRQAAHNIEGIDQNKRAAITRMLGTAEWERELYAPSRQASLLPDDAQIQREADVKGLERFVGARLETIFPKVLAPLALPIMERPQKFSLFFAISNPSPQAIGLASRIAGHILKSGMSSQSRSR